MLWYEALACNVRVRLNRFLMNVFLCVFQGPTYPSIQRQVRSPSWSIRISAYQSIPHWKGWVNFIFYYCRLTERLDLCVSFEAVLSQLFLCFEHRLVFIFTQIRLGCVLPHLYLTLWIVCYRKPLRSAVYLYPMMTLGLRTTAALWPVYGPPSWARTGRAASQGAHEPSREVRIARYNVDMKVKSTHL